MQPKSAPAPKPAPVPATPAQTSSTPAQPAAPQPHTATAGSNVPATPTPPQPVAAAAPAQAEGGGFNDPSAMLMGSRNESSMREMEAMGFERPEIERAMRAAYFNPDRAIEYLLSGIPENLQAEQRQREAQSQQQQQQQAAAPPAPAAPAAGNNPPAAEATADEPVNLFEAAAAAQGQGQRGGAARGGPGAGAGLGAAQAGQGGGVNMDVLRNSPQFQSLRQLVQQNPAMLEPLLQQIAEGNPQLAQMIGQNQEQFLQLLSEDIGGDAIGGMGDAGPLPPGAVPISVTEEERDAIERLCRLGFSRDQVIQAYFACDKNEELAANFLFEQPDDDDQPPPQQ